MAAVPQNFHLNGQKLPTLCVSYQAFFRGCTLSSAGFYCCQRSERLMPMYWAASEKKSVCSYRASAVALPQASWVTLNMRCDWEAACGLNSRKEERVRRSIARSALGVPRSNGLRCARISANIVLQRPVVSGRTERLRRVAKRKRRQRDARAMLSKRKTSNKCTLNSIGTF